MAIDEYEIRYPRGVPRSGLRFLGITIILLLLILILFYPNLGTSETAIAANGILYINDSGESHGGFEYAGEFFANLSYTGVTGKLILSLKIGLGDPLGDHIIRINNAALETNQIVIETEKGDIILQYMSNDPIWPNGMLNQSYVAISSPGNPTEAVGEIQPSIFGLPDHYYVQLSLKLIE